MLCRDINKQIKGRVRARTKGGGRGARQDEGEARQGTARDEGKTNKGKTKAKTQGKTKTGQDEDMAR